MSCQENELYCEQKVDAYNEYMFNLSDEFFGYEFNDRMGCDPEGYFANSINTERRDKQEEALSEAFGSALIDDLDLNWINQDYQKPEGKFYDCNTCIKKILIGSDQGPYEKADGEYECQSCMEGDVK